MTMTALRPPSRDGKAPVRREVVEECWNSFVRARAKAMTSARIEDGLRCGRAWASFLAAFERMDGGG